MNRLIRAVCSVTLLAASNLQATEAIYQVMPLKDISSLVAEGNIVVEVKQANDEKAEIYLRKNGKNSVVITQEVMSNNDNQEQFRLRVREQPNEAGNQNEAAALAVVKLYLKQVDLIIADELHKLTISGQFDLKDALAVRLVGDSKAEIDLTTEAFHLNLSNSSSANITALNANRFNLSLRNQSSAVLGNGRFQQQYIKIAHQANFTMQNTQSNQINIDVRNQAKTVIDKSNKHSLADIKVKNQANVKFDVFGLEQVNATTRNHALLSLGGQAKLNAKAHNSSLITYVEVDRTQLKVKLANAGKVEKVEIANE